MQTITRSPVREFNERLKAGERLGQSEILEVMNHYYGSSANGSWSWKLATDAIESAMALYLLQQPDLSLAQMRELQNLTVDHSVRSQEQIDLQQFSSPLELGWLVGRAAMVDVDDVLVEPSAGTGILVGASINQGVKPTTIVLNEFSKSRRNLLSEIFPSAELFSVNAEYLNDMLLQRIEPSVIVMNPPFSRSITSTKRNPDVCLRHLRSALMRLLPNGRLVAIVAHWLSPQKHPEYFATLPAKLRLSVYLDGSFYRHHGTTMPTRLLVFDKVTDNAAESCRSIEHTMTIEEIGEIIKLVLPPRLPMVSVEPAVDDSLLALPLFTSISVNPFGNLPLFQLTGGGSATATDNLQITVKPIKPVLAPILPAPKSQFCEIVELEYAKLTERKAPELSDDIYQHYAPSAIVIPNAAPHPTPLVESSAMAAITAPYPTCVVKLPARIIRDGLASREQLEALIYTCDAHAKHMDTKWKIDDTGSVVLAKDDDLNGKYHRKGMMIADGTGCGKGVEAALVILTNWCEGRKRAVFVTKNMSLLPDIQRDWIRLGGDAEQIVPLNNFKLGDKIKLNEGILFVTYGGLKTAASGSKKSRVDQIIEWVGEDFEGAICFDEAHMLGNCTGETNDRGQTGKASQQALAGTELIARLPDARVVYLSATGAAKVDNLAYCWRLGLWMTKEFPFKSREQFLAKMGIAGVTILECLTQDLKRLGLFISRTLSFDGVVFETMTHNLTPDQRRIWDTYAQAFEVIHQNIDKAIKAINLSNSTGLVTNARAKATIMSRFEGFKLQFFNGILCAVKAPTLISAIEADLAAGKSCIIQLVSTNEAILDRKLAQIPTEAWGDLRSIDFTARETIADYLMNAFPVYLYVEYEDDSGNKSSKIATDEAGEPIFSKEAIGIRDRLMEDMALLPPLTGLLDTVLWHFGVDKVAEVTGRTKRIVYKDNRYQLSTRSASASVAETIAFQSGQKRILVFSGAGSTGKSYHADRDCLNQDPRRHYVLESGFNVVTAMQSFGRSNRSGQVSAPEIVMISTDVRGEMRFVSTISARLNTLGAISKGSRETGNNGLFDQDANDITSQYAKSALEQFIFDLYRDRIQGMSIGEFERRTGLRLTTDTKGKIAEPPKLTTFLNRLLALPIYSQNLVFGEFEQRIRSRIAQAKEMGIYDRGLETLYSEHGFEIVESQILHTQGNAETICYTIEKLSKPQIVDAETAKAKLLQGYQYYRHRKSQAVAMAIVGDARVKQTGSIVDVLHVSYPVADRLVDRIDVPDFKAWDVVTPDDDFWCKWTEIIATVPNFIRQRFYLVSGLLLPIWDKLPIEGAKIWRLQANDGRVLIGRAIEAKDIAAVLANFGIDTTESLDAATIYRLIWHDNSIQQVGDKWKIAKCYFKGSDRLEILEVYDRADLNWLRSIGCFTEMPNSQMRVFIPLDKVEEIIEFLLK
jgi:P-loop containing NTP hydrolase pore-1/C-terminal domain on Strawberry notch homologue